MRDDIRVLWSIAKPDKGPTGGAGLAQSAK
jgi:hypothetical protein